MSANTETTGADRTKCAEWCGIDSTEDKARARAYLSPANRNYGERGKDRKLYCSPACRDARLPPIAAPAAHIERRKGQRWKWERNGQVYVGVLVRQSGSRWECDPVGMFGDSDWDGSSGATMTLLADAPPESAKPMRLCEHCCTATEASGPDVDAVMCSTCVGAGYSLRPKKSPSAQEAPKAAPALEWSFTDDENRVHRFATGGERDTASRAYGAWMKAQTGKPYAGPERLPRPQLAADWVEDCLEDAR